MWNFFRKFRIPNLNPNHSNLPLSLPPYFLTSSLPSLPPSTILTYLEKVPGLLQERFWRCRLHFTRSISFGLRILISRNSFYPVAVKLYYKLFPLNFLRCVGLLTNLFSTNLLDLKCKILFLCKTQLAL